MLPDGLPMVHWLFPVSEFEKKHWLFLSLQPTDLQTRTTPSIGSPRPSASPTHTADLKTFQPSISHEPVSYDKSPSFYIHSLLVLKASLIMFLSITLLSSPGFSYWSGTRKNA